MNLKFLLKAILILAVLGILVIMGMHNSGTATLNLPPILPHTLEAPSGYMYFGFFGVGFLVGAIIMTGGKKGSSAKSGKDK